MERKQIWVFIEHSAPFCFLDQSSPESLAEVALCLSSLTPGLTQGPTHWLGTGVVRREGHGLATLSQSCLGLFQQDPGWVSKDGSRFSDSPFSTWQLHRPFLQHVMARPHYIFPLYAKFFPTQESRTWGMQTFTVTSRGHQQHHLCWIHKFSAFQNKEYDFISFIWFTGLHKLSHFIPVGENSCCRRCHMTRYY